MGWTSIAHNSSFCRKQPSLRVISVSEYHSGERELNWLLQDTFPFWKALTSLGKLGKISGFVIQHLWNRLKTPKGLSGHEGQCSEDWKRNTVPSTHWFVWVSSAKVFPRVTSSDGLLRESTYLHLWSHGYQQKFWNGKTLISAGSRLVESVQRIVFARLMVISFRIRADSCAPSRAAQKEA